MPYDITIKLGSDITKVAKELRVYVLCAGHKVPEKNICTTIPLWQDILSLWQVFLFGRWTGSLEAVAHSGITEFSRQSLYLPRGFIPSSTINQRSVSLQNKVRGLRKTCQNEHYTF